MLSFGRTWVRFGRCYYRAGEWSDMKLILPLISLQADADGSRLHSSPITKTKYVEFTKIVLTIWVSYKAGNFLTSSATISFSTRDLLQADAAPSLLRWWKVTPLIQLSRNWNRVSMNEFPIHTKWSDSIDFPFHCAYPAVCKAYNNSRRA